MEAKKYMYRVWGDKIQKFEVLKVTEQTVYWTTKTGREDYQRKVSEFHNWFETVEDAVTFILNSTEKEISLAKLKVKHFEAKKNQLVQKYKVKGQTYFGSNVEGFKIGFVELGELELEVYNR